MYNYLIPRQQANKMGIHPDTGRGEDVGGAVAQAGLDYAASIAPFLSPLNAPCTAPPYGQLAAVDLQTNKIIWNARIGTSHDTGPLGIKSHLDIPLGTQIAGGSLVTRSGLVFMGAASEEAFRAFDAKTGKVIWKDRLPAAPNATPMTYVSPKSNKQFVVIAAGGHTMLQTKPGDYIIAYTLEP
jgi:quinoprotein glucose dehydrogenase